MEETIKIKSLKGKVLINSKLIVTTGLHIGGGSDFAPIGAVDSPFIRDTLTNRPIIPGSSLKGKIRTLLAKKEADTYILNDIKNDSPKIARLFGSTANRMTLPARLQFFDIFVNEKSCEKFEQLDTDTYLGEAKFENTISRATGVATPRQIERVPAGMCFDFKLVYNVESLDELHEDLELLKEGLTLLQYDYLGGHGSRGYGRVKFKDFTISKFGEFSVDIEHWENVFKGCEEL